MINGLGPKSMDRLNFGAVTQREQHCSEEVLADRSVMAALTIETQLAVARHGMEVSLLIGFQN